MAIKKFGTLLMNTSNPANMHLLDINASIDIYNSTPTLENLRALREKVKHYEFSKLPTATAIDLNNQIDRELEDLKKMQDLISVRRLVTATVDCRAGGRVLQILGGGGDEQQEGGGYASWTEHGFERVCKLDAHNAMRFEEVAHELAQEVTANTLSKPLIAFLTKPATFTFKGPGEYHTFTGWVRSFRGRMICAQRTSGDAKQWLLSIVKEVPHFKQLSGRYTLDLDNATRRGDDEYNAYAAEKLRRKEAVAKNLVGTLRMPEKWEQACMDYVPDSGNWVLQEFVRLNKGLPQNLVSKQYEQVRKAVDAYLRPQLGDWTNGENLTFLKAWQDRGNKNRFGNEVEIPAEFRQP